MTIISPLIRMQQQLRIFHWQTRSYAQHKAFGKAYESLDDHIDDFVEVFMGKYGRPIAHINFSVDLDNELLQGHLFHNPHKDHSLSGYPLVIWLYCDLCLE